MKLADPRTIQSNINAQRKIDIDQGIALARRVDALREEIATLEKRLILVRDGMTKEVNEQIAALVNKKILLEEEIERLEITRKRLLEPLDKEWELVDKEKAHIEIARDELASERANLEKTAEDVENRRQALIVDESRQEGIRNRTKEQAEKLSETLKKAAKRLAETLKEEKRISAVSEQRLREMDKREAILTATMKHIAIREREIDAEWKDIHSEKVRLADQRATLERAIARK